MRILIVVLIGLLALLGSFIEGWISEKYGFDLATVKSVSLTVLFLIASAYQDSVGETEKGTQLNRRVLTWILVNSVVGFSFYEVVLYWKIADMNIYYRVIFIAVFYVISLFAQLELNKHMFSEKSQGD